MPFGLPDLEEESPAKELTLNHIGKLDEIIFEEDSSSKTMSNSKSINKPSKKKLVKKVLGAKKTKLKKQLTKVKKLLTKVKKPLHKVKVKKTLTKNPIKKTKLVKKVRKPKRK